MFVRFTGGLASKPARCYGWTNQCSHSPPKNNKPSFEQETMRRKQHLRQFAPNNQLWKSFLDENWEIMETTTTGSCGPDAIRQAMFLRGQKMKIKDIRNIVAETITVDNVDQRIILLSHDPEMSISNAAKNAKKRPTHVEKVEAARNIIRHYAYYLNNDDLPPIGRHLGVFIIPLNADYDISAGMGTRTKAIFCNPHESTEAQFLRDIDNGHDPNVLLLLNHNQKSEHYELLVHTKSNQAIVPFSKLPPQLQNEIRTNCIEPMYEMQKSEEKHNMQRIRRKKEEEDDQALMDYVLSMSKEDAGQDPQNGVYSNVGGHPSGAPQQNGRSITLPQSNFLNATAAMQSSSTSNNTTPDNHLSPLASYVPSDAQELMSMQPGAYPQQNGRSIALPQSNSLNATAAMQSSSTSNNTTPYNHLHQNNSPLASYVPPDAQELMSMPNGAHHQQNGRSIALPQSNFLNATAAMQSSSTSNNTTPYNKKRKQDGTRRTGDDRYNQRPTTNDQRPTTNDQRPTIHKLPKPGPPLRDTFDGPCNDIPKDSRVIWLLNCGGSSTWVEIAKQMWLPYRSQCYNFAVHVSALLRQKITNIHYHHDGATHFIFTYTDYDQVSLCRAQGKPFNVTNNPTLEKLPVERSVLLNWNEGFPTHLAMH